MSDAGRLDQEHLWHPFTQMKEWCDPAQPPLVIDRGEGAWLFDEQGRRYLDGNSSIWTNLHGHRHPRIDAAIREQLGRMAHVSFLGLTHAPAAELAARLVGLFPSGTLSRVFLSDDGSTAMECALKMALQHWQLRGEKKRTRFVTFHHAYHGDTLGAASLGGIGAFAGGYEGRGLPVHRLATAAELAEVDGSEIAAVVLEPLVQGAAGIRTWPEGMLRELRSWCDQCGTLLLLDEVLTGFGRTGTMFACEQEGVTPDLMAVAKGLTGGYLPLAATLATEEIFESFLGGYDQTFFYGHSYTGNALGCAAALASLDIFEDEIVLPGLAPRIEAIARGLASLSVDRPCVGEIRQCGMIAGFDLHAPDGAELDWKLLSGAKLCGIARKHGLLTRSVRDVIVFMPPLCTSEDDIAFGIEALGRALDEWVDQA